jgi:AcrR family transcriptional regulator
MVHSSIVATYDEPVAKSNAVRIDRTERADRREPTRWGDRQQRRTDILDAGRTLIAERGYLALNMRDLAAAAGVSPATLYSYFATKEALFATLYAEAIRAHTEAFRPVAAAGHDLATLLADAIEAHTRLYRSYGRHFTLWSAMRHEEAADAARVPRELVAELRDATVEHNRLFMEAVRTAAAREGRTIVDDRRVASFLWSMLNGLADHATSERRGLDPFPARALVEFSAARLALAITEPAVTDA